MNLASEERFLAAAAAEAGMPISAGVGEITEEARNALQEFRQQRSLRSDRRRQLDELLCRAQDLNDRVEALESELDEVLAKAARLREEMRMAG